MKFEHEFVVPAPPDEAWAALTDVQRVASCMPGAKLLDSSDNEFSAQLRVKVGPVTVAYSGVGHFAEMDEASGNAVLVARGKEVRGSGTANATIEMKLVPDGAGTRVRVISDLDITGRPAQFGRGVLQDVGANIIDKFAGELAKSLRSEPEPASPASPEQASGPAQTPDRSKAQVRSQREAAQSSPGATAGPSRGEGGPDEALELGGVIWKPVLRRAAAPLAGVVLGAVTASLLRPRRREFTLHVYLHSDT